MALHSTHHAGQAGRLGRPAGHLLQVPGPTPLASPSHVCHAPGPLTTRPSSTLVWHRLEFGLVFFIASCFYWVWDSMSSSSSSASTVDGERVSAYSVFNRGVNALPGSLPHRVPFRVRACVVVRAECRVCRVRLQQGR